LYVGETIGVQGFLTVVIAKVGPPPGEVVDVSVRGMLGIGIVTFGRGSRELMVVTTGASTAGDSF
jgi:hypothetical protein